MLEILIAAVITIGMGFLVIKKYKPQPVILLGGLLLLGCALMMGKGIIAK